MEKYKLIHISPVSVTIERENEVPFCDNEIDVYLNGELVIEKEKRNVFSIFNLIPNTDYVVRIENEELSFTTLAIHRVRKVCDEGAINDGKTDNTEVLQNIFDTSSNDLIVFTSGIYYTKPLTIHSNTYVYIEKDAEIRGSSKREDYPIVEAYGEKDGKRVVNASWEGTPADCFQSLITIVDSENIMVVGEGSINGNANNGDWWLGDVRIKKGAWRGNNVFVNRSKNIDFVGLTIENSPSWNVHPFYSDHLHFLNLIIRSFIPSPNTDGFDPESCDDVHLVGCEFYCGDDCVAIKSGKAVMTDEFYRPCTNLQIRNCLMKEGHGAIVFGSESSCGIYHVNVSKCIFEKTDRGLRIKTKRGRGDKANIGDISFDNILMDGVKNGLVVNMYYFLAKDSMDDPAYDINARPKDHTTPHLGAFHFKNMKCLDTKITAGYFYGLPESKIDSIVLENIEVTYDKSYTAEEKAAMNCHCEKLNNAGYYFYNVEKVEVKNVSIDGQKGEKYNLFNVGEKNIA